MEQGNGRKSSFPELVESEKKFSGQKSALASQGLSIPQSLEPERMEELVDDEDSWGDEVPVRDLNQSGDDEQEVAEAGVQSVREADDGEWVSEEDEDNGSDSQEGRGRDGLEHEPTVTLDETSALAEQLYSLQDRLAVADRAARLEEENELLRLRLAEAEQQLIVRGERLQHLQHTQLEILTSMTALKQNSRGFQESILRVLEELPPEVAARELGTLVRQLVRKQRASDAAAEARELGDDSAVLASVAHPVDKLMRLTRLVNPLESSFALVRWALRFDGTWTTPDAPVVVVMIDKMLRFWEATGEWQLYPLYSLICTHFFTKLQRVAEDSAQLASVVTSAMAFFFLVRSEFDPSESTDVVLLRSLQHVLLGLEESHGDQDGTGGGGSDLPNSLMASRALQKPGKVLVKSKRAFWVELRKLVVLGYANLVRNEGERIEQCIRSTLDYIRDRASTEKLTYVDSEQCSPGMRDMLVQLDALMAILNEARSPMALSLQLVGQLLSLFNGHCCNALMLRRSYATMHAAASFRGDLRRLDGWVRSTMPADAVSWLQAKTEPLTEMINILFMNKQQLVRPEIRAELCSNVSTAQLCQLLSSYQSQPGEDSVPLSLIQSLMTTGKSHQADIKTVLIDVAQLSPIDLSVLKERWLTRLTNRELKDAPLPDDICEEFIVFRNKATRRQNSDANAK